MDRRSYRAWWSGIFAVNLIVPLFFASMLVPGLACLGVFLAVTAYWWAGTYACRKLPGLARSLIFGGGVVGLSQLFPLLHIFAGVIGLGLVCPAQGPFPLASNLGVIGGFLATAITGGILLAVATILGLPLALSLRPPPDECKPVGKLPIFDDELGR